IAVGLHAALRIQHTRKGMTELRVTHFLSNSCGYNKTYLSRKLSAHLKHTYHNHPVVCAVLLSRVSISEAFSRCAKCKLGVQHPLVYFWGISMSTFSCSTKSSTVLLDIGGTIFKTTTDTLMRGGPNCKLCSCWSDIQAGKSVQFFDRDGKYFHFILNFLRTSRLHCPNKLHVLQQLLSEAKFYNIQSLTNELKGRIGSKRQKKPKQIQFKQRRNFTHYSSKETISAAKENFSFIMKDTALDSIERSDRVPAIPLNVNLLPRTEFDILSQDLCGLTDVIGNSLSQSYSDDRNLLMNDAPPPPEISLTSDLGAKEFSMLDDF
ncbi:K+ channel tetramerization domain-containing protein, partial [Cardiosporidium cionae]